MMNRGDTLAEYMELLAYIRRQLPETVLTTDLIVGFPGETEAMHRETLRLLEEVEYDMAYTFIFSKRSGTPAAAMQTQVDDEIKKRRLQELMDVQNEISLRKNREMVGKTFTVIAEGPTKKNKDNWFGRTSGNKMILFPYQDGMRIGDTMQVQVDRAQTWILTGTPTERRSTTV